MQLFIFNYPVKLMPCTTRLAHSRLPFPAASASYPHILCLRHDSAQLSSAICEKFVFSPVAFVAAGLATISTADGGLALKYWLLA